jgi:RNA polymerase sigma-70 factor (ECF subfamily)
MAEGNSFLELIRSVRAGDPAGASELVRRYEPAIRRAVRIHLRDPRLRRILDSMDVCQSVLASFFVRAASGQYDLDQPNQLLNLLVVMARNKVASEARRSYVVRRDRQFLGSSELVPANLISPGAGPSEVAADRDLLQAVQSRLSEEERQLVERRSRKQGWDAIAAELGGTPEALRKKLTRALDRIAVELRLDDPDHG